VTEKVRTRARLDADGSAQPKTSIVKRVPESKCMDAVVRDGDGALRDNETRDEVSLQPVVTFLDANGLVGGDIPANTPCPFRVGCPRRDARCPDNANLRPHPYSCAAARLQSMIKMNPEVR
jgi:hypothetical protein